MPETKSDPYGVAREVVRRWLVKQDQALRDTLPYAQVEALESVVSTALIEAECAATFPERYAQMQLKELIPQAAKALRAVDESNGHKSDFPILRGLLADQSA